MYNCAYARQANFHTLIVKLIIPDDMKEDETEANQMKTIYDRIIDFLSNFDFSFVIKFDRIY